MNFSQVEVKALVIRFKLCNFSDVEQDFFGTELWKWKTVNFHGHKLSLLALLAFLLEGHYYLEF